MDKTKGLIAFKKVVERDFNVVWDVASLTREVNEIIKGHKIARNDMRGILMLQCDFRIFIHRSSTTSYIFRPNARRYKCVKNIED